MLRPASPSPLPESTCLPIRQPPDDLVNGDETWHFTSLRVRKSHPEVLFYFCGVITASVRLAPSSSMMAICLPLGDQLIAMGPFTVPCATTNAARAGYEYSITSRN